MYVTDTGSLFSGVSVVVNTCDRAQYLRDCLQSLASQSIAVEVVVVNGPSTDETESVCRAHPEVIYRKCEERNLSKSRNIGIAAASGSIVAFIDDDAIAHEDWAKHLLSAYSSDRVGGAGGFTLDNTGRAFQSTHLVSDWRADSWSFTNEAAAGLLTEATDHYASVLGANSSFRRSDLVQIGGFDEVYAYFLDETDICARLARIGRVIKTVPSALILHRYAPSHVRNQQRLATSLVATIRSKVYFCYKFARENERTLIDDYIKTFLEQQDFSLKWHIHRAKYSAKDFFRLRDEIRQGADQGRALATNGETNLNHLARWISEERHLGRRIHDFMGGKFQERTRIAFVSQGYPPADTNGIARWTKTIAEASAKSGHVVHVITRSISDQSTTEYINGVWVHFYVLEKALSAHIAPTALPDNVLIHASSVRREVLRVQRLWGLDVVSGPIWDVEAILCHDIPGIKMITSLHTTYALMRPFKTDWRFNPSYDQCHVQPVIEAERWLLEHSHLIVANSQSILDEIRNVYSGVRLSRHITVPHGFELPESVPYEARPDVIRVIFVGRVEKRKGVDLLLKAALEIDLPFELLMIGSNPIDGSNYSQEIADLIKDVQNKKNIRCTQVGFVNDKTLERYYREASIVVVPSRYESFGLVVIEAMGRGIPVVVADVGGMSELVTDGDDGLKFVSDDYLSLRDKLETVMKNRQLRRHLAIRGRQTFEKRFTADQMVRSFFSSQLFTKVRTHADT